MKRAYLLICTCRSCRVVKRREEKQGESGEFCERVNETDSEIYAFSITKTYTLTRNLALTLQRFVIVLEAFKVKRSSVRCSRKTRGHSHSMFLFFQLFYILLRFRKFIQWQCDLDGEKDAFRSCNLHKIK